HAEAIVDTRPGGSAGIALDLTPHCCGVPRVDDRRPESLSHLRTKYSLTRRQDSRDGVDARRVTREGSVPSSVHRSDHATRRGLLTFHLLLASYVSQVVVGLYIRYLGVIVARHYLYIVKGLLQILYFLGHPSKASLVVIRITSG